MSLLLHAQIPSRLARQFVWQGPMSIASRSYRTASGPPTRGSPAAEDRVVVTKDCD